VRDQKKNLSSLLYGEPPACGHAQAGRIKARGKGNSYIIKLG